MPGFEDHFSRQAAAYQRHRPAYPDALFAALAEAAPARGFAIDVATGNGQAALGLAAHFRTVLATEPSAAQLAAAPAHPRLRYACEPAERIGAPDASADLLTAAQAAHWFDWPAFCAEARRVLRPGGLLAIWCYALPRTGAAPDVLVDSFYRDVVGPYWPRARFHVEEGYRGLPLPFAEVPLPSWRLETDWEAAGMLDFLGTWSAVQRCRARTGRDPLALLAGPLQAAWGRGARRLVWPMVLRAARA